MNYRCVVHYSTHLPLAVMCQVTLRASRTGIVQQLAFNTHLIFVLRTISRTVWQLVDVRI